MTLKVDGQVDPGVYRLTQESLGPRTGGGDEVQAAADGGPILVLVHGTFSSTTGTFKHLWDLHGDVLAALFTAYGGRVYGLDHATLGASPIANALMLARALPAGARVHLLTHSRGGLVAELLALACAGGGVDETSLAPFKARGYEQHLKDLRALIAEARGKGLRVERSVRVGCPARGTLLASKPARRLPVGAHLGPAARQRAGAAAARRFPARSGAPPCAAEELPASRR